MSKQMSKQMHNEALHCSAFAITAAHQTATAAVSSGGVNDNTSEAAAAFCTIVGQPELFLRIISHLTCQHACFLACSTKSAAAHQQLLNGSSTMAGAMTNAPRVVIVASGNSKILELSLSSDGRQMYNSSADRGGSYGTFGIIQFPVQCKKRRARSRLTMSHSRPRSWLTGIASGPHDRHLYVCDYAVRGVRKLTGGSLRPLGIFASDSLLSMPEGIAFAAGMCYVASLEHNSIVSINPADGCCHQTLELPPGLVPWGLTAWDPHSQQNAAPTAAAAACAAVAMAAAAATGPATPAAAAAAAAAARDDGHDQEALQGPALFVAVDVSYESVSYHSPPATASGSVLQVPVLGGTGQMSRAVEFTNVPIKRPSGLCFDSQGHMWVTSLDCLLLRFNGPGYPNSGHLLQTLNLSLLLPTDLQRHLPFDVQPIACQAAVAAAAPSPSTAGLPMQNCSTPGYISCGNSTTTTTSSSSSNQQGRSNSSISSTVLVVTLHKGSKAAGAVAVLQLMDPSSKAPMPAQQATVEQQVCVELLQVISNDRALKEPNMIAIQM